MDSKCNCDQNNVCIETDCGVCGEATTVSDGMCGEATEQDNCEPCGEATVDDVAQPHDVIVDVIVDDVSDEVTGQNSTDKSSTDKVCDHDASADDASVGDLCPDDIDSFQPVKLNEYDLNRYLSVLARKNTLITMYNSLIKSYDVYHVDLIKFWYDLRSSYHLPVDINFEISPNGFIVKDVKNKNDDQNVNSTMDEPMVKNES
jgi:hypothetical protein